MSERLSGSNSEQNLPESQITRQIVSKVRNLVRGKRRSEYRFDDGEDIVRLTMINNIVAPWRRDEFQDGKRVGHRVDFNFRTKETILTDDFEWPGEAITWYRLDTGISTPPTLFVSPQQLLTVYETDVEKRGQTPNVEDFTQATKADTEYVSDILDNIHRKDRKGRISILDDIDLDQIIIFDKERTFSEKKADKQVRATIKNETNRLLEIAAGKGRKVDITSGLPFSRAEFPMADAEITVARYEEKDPSIHIFINEKNDTIGETSSLVFVSTKNSPLQYDDQRTDLKARLQAVLNKQFRPLKTATKKQTQYLTALLESLPIENNEPDNT